MWMRAMTVSRSRPRLGRAMGIAVTLAMMATACARSVPAERAAQDELVAAAVEAGAALDTAIFAGGCFWCMEPPFDETEGVLSTTSGYIGGHVADPTYRQVVSGTTGHTEAVRVVFDPERVTYAQLLDVFWRNIDPLTPDRQFCDVGSQYRAGIFHLSDDQRRAAEASKVAIERSGRFEQPIVTEITEASTFYEAEEYHQDYYRKNPIRYRFYRANCGRDRRLAELWGDG
jgi:peptide-methionine (S)-S-oxide reductase